MIKNLDNNSKRKIVIESINLEIDGGKFPVKRVIGEDVIVEADIFIDGHDIISSSLMYRKKEQNKWNEVSMKFLVNDRWRGAFKVSQLGIYLFTIKAWIDKFKTLKQDMQKKLRASQKIMSDLGLVTIMGEKILEQAKDNTDKEDIKEYLSILTEGNYDKKVSIALSKHLEILMDKYFPKDIITIYEKELQIIVDREKANFSSWYEVFPRSLSSGDGKHGTLKDLISFLPYIADLGFNVLYLPPIHPIGHKSRRGKNNSPVATNRDPGSPWAIGSSEGGHKSIHPKLGNMDDFKELVKQAEKLGLEVALDIAFQCSPEHPYIGEHPDWFFKRPDGSIKYAENPPKKYEDIFPLNFEAEEYKKLWLELKSVIEFWIRNNIKIFRVDNPHTKPFNFWEWLIKNIKNKYPEAIFLSEAFTRPKVMYYLAKLGFDQSYTYFTWRNTKWELIDYFSELYNTKVKEYFRPNLWPNTPDILSEYLQTGKREVFIIRLVLAATLSSSYGIYGPAFELCEHRPKELGSEEYLDSEKYQIRNWDLEYSENIRFFIKKVNQIRNKNKAFQNNRNLEFLNIDNDQILSFFRKSREGSNIILVVVNLDPYNKQSGWLEVPIEKFGINPDEVYQMQDLLSGSRYQWTGNKNYVELDPYVVPAHIFLVKKFIRSEKDFNYFM